MCSSKGIIFNVSEIAFLSWLSSFGRGSVIKTVASPCTWMRLSCKITVVKGKSRLESMTWRKQRPHELHVVSWADHWITSTLWGRHQEAGNRNVSNLSLNLYKISAVLYKWVNLPLPLSHILVSSLLIWIIKKVLLWGKKFTLSMNQSINNYLFFWWSSNTLATS